MKQDTFWGTKDDMKNEQEEFEEKLRYAKEEILQIKNKNEELKSKLNYEYEEKKIL